MEPAAGLCMFVAFGAIVAVAIAFSAAQAKALNHTYMELARHHGGTSEPGGWFTRPSATFTHSGNRVKVDIFSTGGKHPTYYTQVHIYCHLLPRRFEVYPERVLARVGKLLGMQDIEIGVPDFDDNFVIKGTDEAEIKEMLTPAAIIAVEQLRRFRGNNQIYISYYGGELLVKKISKFTELAVLLQYTKLATDLYDTLASPTITGIEYIEDTSAPDLTDAICQVCGEPMDTDVVLCKRCRTPHHRDCWEYYGSCSTYGCEEPNFITPK